MAHFPASWGTEVVELIGTEYGIDYEYVARSLDRSSPKKSMATTTTAAPASAAILQNDNNHNDDSEEGGEQLQRTPPPVIPPLPPTSAVVAAATGTTRATTTSTAIRVLPPDVVDRIAAGEAIQRPAQAIKELLENALDAHATEIRIHVVGGGLESLHVSDNGCGIGRNDLLLAATRHATSKLQKCSDLEALSTFGFRGEALASVSHVAHLLTITSRTAHSPLAYRMSYRGGIPVAPHSIPHPCARSLGTTIAIDDLFYSLPHRKASFRPKDEYQKILRVAQHYAIHVAQLGIGIVCESETTPSSSSSSSRGNNKASNHGSRSGSSGGGVHLNTGALPSVQRVRMDRRSGTGTDSVSSATLSASSASAEGGNDPLKDLVASSAASFQATRDAIVHALGSDLRDSLHPFMSCLGQSSPTALSIPASPPPSPDKEEDAPTLTAPSYSCTGLVTDHNASSSTSSSSTNKRTSDFVLFVNHRLVDCPPIQKAVEDAYRGTSSTSSSHSGKPCFFAYLSLEVPSHHVDVNVHPTKRRVTLLHLDVVTNHLRDTLRDFLSRRGQTFALRGAQPLQAKAAKASADKSKRDTNPATATFTSSGSAPTEEADDDSSRPPVTKKLRGSSSTGAPTPTPPLCSQRIRTSASTPAGALEPFLVPTQRSSGRGSAGSGTNSGNSIDASQQSSSSSGTQPASQQSDTDPSQSVNPDAMEGESDLGRPLSAQHEPSCPLALDSNSSAPTVDMTQPGAFAVLASQCTCRQPPPEEDSAVVTGAASVVRLPRQAVPRPKRVAPTECRYTSVAQLRRRLNKRSSSALQAKLRASVWVGLASPHRSLLQCGEELVEVHHARLAEHLFYQLALWRFAGADLARLEPPLNVEQLVEASVRLEERLGTGEEGLEEPGEATGARDGGSPVSDTNQILARQVAACLLQNAEMLLEYFSIAIERDARSGTVLLTGLPVLLEGYTPSPHGVPLFLLRLATEVDWTDERPCFHGVCRELASFYAQCCPTGNDGNDQCNGTGDALSHQVRHSLFPAVATLLIPPQELEQDETAFRVLTSLSKLYRVFERC